MDLQALVKLNYSETPWSFKSAPFKKMANKGKNEIGWFSSLSFTIPVEKCMPFK
jgi:hypothetical protein